MNESGNSWKVGSRLLHEFFDQTWRRWPDAIAVDVPTTEGASTGERCTYAELAHRSRSVTTQLAGRVRSGERVALLLSRTAIDGYAAQLGVLRAGAAYVSLDPSSPDDRLATIVADAEPALLLTDGDGARRATALDVASSHVIVLGGSAATSGVEAPTSSATPESLAYLIYTSGTSGRPKGVMVGHAAISNLVASDVGAFQLAPGDRVAQTSSHGYDSSVEEIWLALASGATLVIADDEVVRSGPDFANWLALQEVTVVCPSPTLLQSTGRRSTTDLRDLRLVYVGGEAISQDLVSVWSAGRRLVNGYGPTECAVTALRGDLETDRPVTIGRPVPGVGAHVLDANMNPVRDREQGELYLSGTGLASGYWHSPALTDARFVRHPHLGRIYRTGDLARRLPDGEFLFDGRRDAQVKIRGHRIELEDVEAHLGRCKGVRAAACAVQNRRLVAFIVSRNPRAPVSASALTTSLSSALPSHMVPTHFESTDQLPVTTSGKLDRSALPATDVAQEPSASRASPDNGDDVENIIASAVAATAGRGRAVGADDDFFTDLGGDSLAAAEFVTALRQHSATSAVTVRDVYAAPTARLLAGWIRARSATADGFTGESGGREPRVVRRGESDPGDSPRPALVTAIQTAWLVLGLVTSATVGALLVVGGLPWLLLELGLVPTLLVAPFVATLATAVYVVASACVAVITKRRLIGEYTPLQAPAWGRFYLKNWFVQRSVRLVPWTLIAGTEFQNIILRALGARIGKRVHLHRGVEILDGGWDLLSIGDDVTVGQEVTVRLVDFEAGTVVVGPIAIESGATLEVRSGVGPHTVVGPGACLAPLSALREGQSVPAGELWSGVPAERTGLAPDRPGLTRIGRELSPVRHAFLLVGARLGVAAVIALPFEVTALILAFGVGGDASRLLSWLANPGWNASVISALLAVTALPLVVSLALQAKMAAWLGPVPTGVISRWSTEYARVWVKTDLVDQAGRWLAGTLAWPVWLRAAGMSVGPKAEVSTIIDVVPEHLTIGRGCFLTDGVYPGGPRVDRGTVTMASTRLGDGVFLGNHAVIPAGVAVPDGVLLGVCTVADDRALTSGSSWFGLPPFRLARPQPADQPESASAPSWPQYVIRVFWEWARLALLLPPLIATVWWFGAVARAATLWPAPFVYGLVAPVAALVASAGLCLLALGAKWLLLGRVRPGQHAFWSSWCGRWDFVYMVWDRVARPVLAGLEGTLLLAWYLRAMGARIGRRVVLGPGSAQLVDPDMVRVDDDATVRGMFQAHTFEDHVLKIDRLRVGREATVASGALLFYGADVGQRAIVLPHSVVMKRERLPAGCAFEGSPVRDVGRAPASRAQLTPELVTSELREVRS